MEETKNVQHTTPAAPKPKRRFWDYIFVVIILSLVFIFAGQITGMIAPALIGIIVGIFAPSFAENNTAFIETSNLYIIFIGIWALMILVLALSKKDRTILKAIGKGVKGNNITNLLIGLGIGLGMNLLCALIAMLNGDIKLQFDAFRPVSFLLLFVFVFIQSSAEELVCRGYVYQKLNKSYGIWTAVIVNSVFFGALHVANPGVTIFSILNIIIYGALCTAMVYYMDSIWAAFGCHAAWNFCQNILLGLPNSGNVVPYSVFKLDAAAAQNSFAYDVGFGIEGTTLSCVVLFAVTVLIVLWGRKHNKKPTDIWQEG